MVIRTPALHSLKKGFLPQIHHPLPLTNRESQQLLDSITKSFRKNLDQDHHDSTSLSQESFNPRYYGRVYPTDTSPTTTNRSRYVPTDRHLRAVLSNPLFNHSDHDAPVSAATNKNPFEVFDHAIAKGLMTPRRAAGFLAAVRAQAATQPLDQAREAMSTSGAGLRVVRWLRASGHENDLEFLSEPAVTLNIIPFMYAEGLEEVAWTWLARLAARGTDLEFERLSRKSLYQLLSAITRVTSQGAVMMKTSQPEPLPKTSLDATYAALIRANSIFTMKGRVVMYALKNMWTQVAWASTVGALGRPKPSAPMFDLFSGIGRPFKLFIDSAHLEVHHPTSPRYDAAVKLLLEQQERELPSRTSSQTRTRLVCLALDTASLLRQLGHKDEISRIEQFMGKLCEKLDLGMLNIPGRDPGHPNFYPATA